MSRFPTFEEVLLEVRQSLGCKQLPTKTKIKFALGELEIANHFEKFEGILKDIFESLGINSRDEDDIINNLVELSGAYKKTELSTETLGASKKQVLWHLLASFFIPGLARRAAFWNLGSQLDKGMPGGQFWYLPTLTEDGLILPVTKVIDWLLDLLGYSIDAVPDKTNPCQSERAESFVRTLYNWKAGSNTPQLNSIVSHFNDDFDLPFEGTFELPSSMSPSEKFDAALTFVADKKLDAEQLRLQIPMTSEGRIEAILSGSACNEEKAYFVELLASRYAKPSMQTVRQKLIFARMVQDGYQRLVKHLFPNTSHLCPDPEQNKVLQLIGIYEFIYNLTIDAYKTEGHKGESAEGEYFESRLPPWYSSTLFLSIIPSLRLKKIDLAGAYLNESFRRLSNTEEIENVFGMTSKIEREIKEQWLNFTNRSKSEQNKTTELLDSLSKTTTRNALKKEYSFSVVNKVVTSSAISDTHRSELIPYLRRLASSPDEIMQAIVHELGVYFSGTPTLRPPQCFGKVESLLSEAKSNIHFKHHKAKILYFEALHLMALNKFTEAEKVLIQAHETSKENHVQSLRGEIALSCLAINITNQKISPSRQQKYYRSYINFLDFREEQIPDFETAAREGVNFLWCNLYQPYQELEKLQPDTMDDFKEFYQLFLRDNYKALKAWLKIHKNRWNKKSLDKLNNSFLMLLVKMQNMKNYVAETRFPEVAWDMIAQKMDSVIKQVIKLAPEQLNQQDFKGQTPLMLVTESNNPDLVHCFLKAGANPNLQNYQGMTAIHTAAKSKNTTLIDLLLSYNPIMQKTLDGNNILHTSAWSTNEHSVKKILKVAPQLLWEKNEYGFTALEYVEYLKESPETIEAINKMLADADGNQITPAALDSVIKILTLAIESS